ncbi:MAG TPA: hypothetical protein PLQ00_07815 [Thermoguttaceae bacterium]|nr:hypothetical protein [Thermoguttaceae bacterium]
MSLDWDVRKDFSRAADGWAEVRLVPGRQAEQAPSDGSEQSDPPGYPAQALRQAVSAQEAAQSGGQYTATDVVWHLAAEGLPQVPAPGDFIVDGQGVRYRVLQTKSVPQAGRYRCVCRHVAIQAGLDTLVDVERAQPTKSPDGVEVLQWTVWRSGLRAKVQPVETRLQIEDDQMTIQTRLKIYFAEPVALDQRCRIRGPDGSRYRILAVRGQERIDGLMEADVEPIQP